MDFESRGKLCTNSIAKKLFEIMAEKCTNLAIAADVTSSEAILNLADKLGPYICVFKTHIDIISDFTPSLTEKLTELAQKHNFLIFEDRKFADIGEIVAQQYVGGIYKIIFWANIINAHVVVGPGTILGLRSITQSRGLVLIAEMSSEGSCVSTKTALKLAEDNADFVIGFIAQKKLIDDPRFIHMTPGVNISRNADVFGQQYNSPDHVIYTQNSDIIIVGRGILQAPDIVEAARHYRKCGWDAYLRKLSEDPILGHEKN